MKSLSITFFFFSCLHAFSQNSTDEAIIRNARQSSNESIAKQDVAGITKFYLDDYVIIRGSGAIETGKENSNKTWEMMFKETPKTSFERIPSEVIISKQNPDMAWESGIWKGFNTYSKGGRYSAQWKRKNGEWKIQAKLFVALEK